MAIILLKILLINYFIKNKKTGHCVFFNDVKQTKKEIAESFKNF